MRAGPARMTERCVGRGPGAPAPDPRWTLRLRRWSSAAIMLLGLGTFSGCAREEDLAPPTIAYGQQECDVCRMLITEERFAAAWVGRQDGQVRKLAFDDVGCLLDHLAGAETGPADPDGIPYVHDVDTRAWLDARRALFVRSDELHTPMGSNLAACASAESAERVRQRWPGPLLRWEDLTGASGGARAEARGPRTAEEDRR